MKPKGIFSGVVSFVAWPPMPKPTPPPPNPPPKPDFPSIPPPETSEADWVIETDTPEVEVDLPPDTESLL